MAGRAELAALLQRAEAEGAAIIEIQRLDADVAEASATGDTAESSEWWRVEHARAVQTVLSTDAVSTTGRCLRVSGWVK